MASELRHVLQVLAQGRNADAADVQAVQEVGAEAAGGHLPLQVAVGGRDDAHVDVQRVVGADRLDLALLQRPQELRLHVQRQLADLVQEERRPGGHAELARPLLLRAGEGAAHMAEELALDHRLGQRGAVHVDQGTLRARGTGVQPAHGELLAHARLPHDEHRELGAAHELDLAAQSLHGRAGADQGPAAPLARVLHEIARHEALVVGARLERVDQVARAQRGGRQGREVHEEALVHGVEGAGLQGIDRQHPHELAGDEQGAADARVHRQVGRPLDQPVVGIGGARCRPGSASARGCGRWRRGADARRARSAGR
jgi:hypothetical protein